MPVSSPVPSPAGRVTGVFVRTQFQPVGQPEFLRVFSTWTYRVGGPATPPKKESIVKKFKGRLCDSDTDSAVSCGVKEDVLFKIDSMSFCRYRVLLV